MLDRFALALERAWFKPPRLLWLLWPLEWCFAGLTALRRLAFRKGWLPSAHPGKPVIVVGNLSVGGTGKTPVVIGITRALMEQGLRVGVVSRGYGGSGEGVIPVTADSDYRLVGDEALLIAQSTGACVTVGRDRLAAARHVAKQHVDVIISDDGLQHYALQRDIEVVTGDVDSAFGNGHLLPVGPLREPPQRLATVDFFLLRGGQDPHTGTSYRPKQFRRLADGRLCAAREPAFGPAVHAVAAIARPPRFFASLRALGLEPQEHAFVDHRTFEKEDFAALRNLPVVMTAKDAVKCPALEGIDAWVLDMEIQFPEDFIRQLMDRSGLSSRQRPPATAKENTGAGLDPASQAPINGDAQ